ncbi:MAG TPA: SIMPL domain-containing protein, partial [Draconibacterium sp.]|nr:SIMPL domain-containing protein [Draconibacterium sp.]
MKKILILFLMITAAVAVAQNKESERIIEVNGKAEMEIEPDEIKFIIAIEEYWKEEFEKKKDFEDYKTKVPLAEIEDALIKNLRNAGIEKEDIKVKSMGNYWRYRGKEFLYSKQFEINITDLSKINKLTQTLDSKGIKYMNIGELNHSKMEEFKKQVKIDALK